MYNKEVKRYSLSKQVADQLEEMIEAGEYQIGEKIHTESELMNIFNVSRNTLREAIKSLASAGILEVKQGDGTYVRSNNRFNANMSREYSQVSIDDIHDARDSIEVTIARLAARRRTETDLALIETSLEKRKNLNDTTKENTIADVEFHMAIAKASHNKILIDLYQSISFYLESHIAERKNTTDMDSSEIDNLHEQLFMAIKNQKIDEATICAKNILQI